MMNHKEALEAFCNEVTAVTADVLSLLYIGTAASANKAERRLAALCQQAANLRQQSLMEAEQTGDYDLRTLPIPDGSTDSER